MKAGNTSVNLSISIPIAQSIQAFVAGNRRKGRRNLSELTEHLWITYLRGKGVKLPPLLKEGADRKAA